MKTVLFIPGFQEDINSRDYKKTINAIKSAGYDVQFVSINWFRTTIDQWVKELDEVYRLHNPKCTILAGFSFGAMTAFVSATKRSPSELWLFSLSPFFNEDLKSDTFNKSWLKLIGHRREDSFKTLYFSKLIRSISSDILFFYGSSELKKWSDIQYRHSLIKKVPNAKEEIIPYAKHDVASDVYVKAIKEIISS